MRALNARDGLAARGVPPGGGCRAATTRPCSAGVLFYGTAKISCKPGKARVGMLRRGDYFACVKVTAALAERIAEHPFLRDLPREFLPVLAENAMDVTFAPDEIIFRTGDPANRFYLLESGEVQLESRNGGLVPIQRIGAGDVLGWSWLFPPYQWQFDARALTEVHAIFLYGSRLRDACEQEAALGYALMRATAGVLIQRLQSTRRELLRCVTKTKAA